MLELPQDSSDRNIVGDNTAVMGSWQPSFSPSDSSSGRTIASQPRLHLDFLDGLRGLAALYVVLHHAYLTVWPSYEHLPTGIRGLLRNWLLFGHFAVSVFIVISGFCLMLPVVRADGILRGGALGFYKKRIRRILPPYYAALGLSLLLIVTLIGHKTGSHWDISVPVTRSGYLGNLLLLQDVVGTYKINHCFWSIAVECQIYLVFPLFLLAWRRFSAKRATLLALLAGYAGFFLLRKTRLSGLTLDYYGLFALGAYGASVAFGKRLTAYAEEERRRWLGLGSACLLCVVAVCAFLNVGTALAKMQYWDLLIGIGTMSLLVAASHPNPSRLKRALSWKPLVGVGIFSYSIYLVHAPLLQVVWQYILRPWKLSESRTFLLLAGPGTLGIIGAAYLFYLVCERPFVKNAATRKSAVAGN